MVDTFPGIVPPVRWCVLRDPPGGREVQEIEFFVALQRRDLTSGVQEPIDRDDFTRMRKVERVVEDGWGLETAEVPECVGGRHDGGTLVEREGDDADGQSSGLGRDGVGDVVLLRLSRSYMASLEDEETDHGTGKAF